MNVHPQVHLVITHISMQLLQSPSHLLAYSSGHQIQLLVIFLAFRSTFTNNYAVEVNITERYTGTKQYLTDYALSMRGITLKSN